MKIKSINKNFLRILLLMFASGITANAATPGLDTLVNYDTAWTYILDGGKQKDGTSPVTDVFYDVKELPGGNCVFAGVAGDTTNAMQSVLMKLNKQGNVILKRLYTTFNKSQTFFNRQALRSIAVAKNGDFIVGGKRWSAPYLMRLSPEGDIKWTVWYYDSLRGVEGSLLPGAGTINNVKETSRGTIICAAGDYFDNPDYTFGNVDYNHAAYFEFDSIGKMRHGGSLNDESGFDIGGFFIEEVSGGAFLVSGNQTLNYIDTGSNTKWQQKYTYQLNGVGSKVADIVRCKKLRDNSFMVAGKVYEGNCWTRYAKLYYDAWWSPVNIDAGGQLMAWDTAGGQGSSDAVYDFTQLGNGNLVFVGYRSDYQRGVWTFVTDSTGKKILWEKVTQIAYKSYTSGSPLCYSVCATADSGFTVAGELGLTDSLGGTNALAMHFKPIDLSRAITRKPVQPKSCDAIVTLKGSHLLVHLENNLSLPQITVFNAAGRMVAVKLCSERTTSIKEFVWDFSTVARGVYFYSIKTGKTVFIGSMIRGM